MFTPLQFIIRPQGTSGKQPTGTRLKEVSFILSCLREKTRLLMRTAELKDFQVDRDYGKSVFYRRVAKF